MNLLYVIVVAGIVLWLALVFEALLGLRVIKLKGVLHGRVHRILAYAIIAGGLIHGAVAVGHLALGLF
jgi:hypothetical protein